MAAIMDKDQKVIKTIKWKPPFESHLLLDLILRKLRWHSLEIAMELSGTYGDSLRELTAVIRIMEMYDDAYRQNVNRLEGLTMRYWPELTQYLQLQSATLLELLKEFGSHESVAQLPQEAGELMRKTGGASLKEEKIKAVLESAPNSLGVKCIEAERE